MSLALSIATLMLLWGAAALGALAFTRIAIPESVRRLCGLGLVSLAGLLLCAIGFPSRAPDEPSAVPAALFVLAGAAGWVVVLRRRAEWACFACTPRAARVSGVVLMGLLGAALIWAQLPPSKIDEGAYHLSIPAHALDLGHFDLIWGHIYTGFPGFGEMLFLWPLALDAESGARAVQIAVVMLGVWSSIELLPKERSPQVIQAWVLLLLIPVAFVELPCAYVDLIQLALEVVGLLCLQRFVAAQEADQAAGALFAAGWLVGSAAATKYLAFATVGLFAALAVLGALRRRRAGLAALLRGTSLKAVLGAMLPVAPWLVKNAVERGNPIFPFGLSVWPSPEFSVLQQRIYDHQLHAVGPLGSDGTPMWGWRALVHLPLDVLFGGQFSSLDLDGVIGPLALVALLLAVLPREHRREPGPGWLLVVYGAFKLAVALATSWQARFLLPACVPICAAIPHWFAELRSARWRIAAGLALTASLAFQGRAIVAALPRLDLRAFGDAEARRALRLERWPDTALCDRARTIEPMSLMLVWSQRLSYWCPAHQISDSIIESISLDNWLAAGGETRALQGFASHGITHLLIDENRLLALPPQALPPAEQRHFRRIAEAYAALRANDLEVVSRGPTRTLYRIVPYKGHP